MVFFKIDKILASNVIENGKNQYKNHHQEKITC